VALSRDEINQQLRALADAVLALLLEHEPKKERPLREVFWDVYHGELKALPVYAEVLALMKVQPAMLEDARVRVRGDLTDRGLDNVVSIFLSTFLLNVITTEYTLGELRIQTLVADACSFLIDRKRTIQRKSFITGALIDNSASTEGIAVRPIEESERDLLRSMLAVWVGDFRAEMVTSGNVVVIDQRTTCSLAELERAASDTKRIAEAMIAYLRIHASSAIVAVYASMESGSLWPGSGVPFVSAIEHVSEDVVLPATILERWHADKITLLAPPPALGVALRRFAMLSDFDNPDRILDQIIILEALFSDDDKQELANKLSLRIANFLGIEFEERRTLYDTMKNGYKARSKISHGRDLPDALRGIDRQVSELVRRAFALYLTYCQRNMLCDRKGEEDFLRRLDERSLGSGPLL
jgi:hypothetical protein